MALRGKTIHTPEQGALCALLVAAREKSGLTQAKLAKRLRRPQSFVAKYEIGERRLDVIEFVKIVRAMNSDPLRLLRALMKNLGR
jgi:transcriptional regulator with XRE-family HTH domain